MSYWDEAMREAYEEMASNRVVNISDYLDGYSYDGFTTRAHGVPAGNFGGESMLPLENSNIIRQTTAFHRLVEPRQQIDWGRDYIDGRFEEG